MKIRPLIFAALLSMPLPWLGAMDPAEDTINPLGSSDVPQDNTPVVDGDGQIVPAESDTPATPPKEPAAPAEPETAPPPTGPEDTYSPDTTGITVKNITEEQPKIEVTVSPQGEREIEQTKEEVPALELDFPTGGEATLEFPTDVTSEVDMEMGDDDTISVDFPNEEVRTIIRNVADLYDLNVVIPETLVGNTTIKLRNVTWRQVFEVVLQPLGYTYVEDRNIIKIKSMDELLQEPVDTRVFLINYALASDLQSSLNSLVDAASGGIIQVDSRTNALIVTERPSRMNDIQEIIERLDQPTPQVMIHSMFIETQTNEELNLGVQWPTSTTFTLQGSGADNAIQLGGIGTLPSSAIGNVNFANNAVLSMTKLEATLNYLQKDTNSRVLNHPTIVTMDGQEAKIAIGEEIPIPEFVFNEETGRFQISGYEYRNTGSVLTVTPHVNSAGFIRLSVLPELSKKGNNGISIAAGTGTTATEIPSFDSKTTRSTVVLKDGYTLVIGGLREKANKTVEDKVPFLGDIPLIGELFTNTYKDPADNGVTDLLIFITARTLNPDGTTYKEMVDPRQLDRMHITDSEIPDYRLPEPEYKQQQEVLRLRNDLDVEQESARLTKQSSQLQSQLQSEEQDDDSGSSKRKLRHGP
ncbi:MAG: secretin N-terminal domain-containing protein [Verrucomicrobiota bacterium JB024]|jgi:type IV pilus assembly protein PilQ|nr:secretin N-terminal domain-containing protein [Verrucomicrobiota bacterium JB024]